MTHRTLLLFASAVLVALAPRPLSAATFRAVDPQCEGLTSPLLIDTTTPRFSWRIESDEKEISQAAYQLRISEDSVGTGSSRPLADTGRVESSQCIGVQVPGFEPHPKGKYRWEVQIWDRQGQSSGWSAANVFETGFMQTPWPAQWLSTGRPVAKDTPARARYFRTVFAAPDGMARAKLFLTAQGLVEPWINGRPVTEDRFLPGWPDYRKRAYYLAYDVTSLVKPGQNAIGLILGDGWYSSTLLLQHQYGTSPRVSAQLEITDTNGKVTVVATDQSWKWADGPITENSIYQGETYDARLADPAWCRSEGNHWNWQTPQVDAALSAELTARLSPPVRRIQEVKPVSVKELRPGVFVYDFGQNLVGWARLKLRARAGQEVQLRHAEMLEPDGSLHLANLRHAKATARYVATGKDEETWEPRFTYFGFRYIELTGVPNASQETLTAVVVHTDLPRIGTFECSHPLLNQLYRNAVWGQKGNFLEVPTDCPQRDERLGWTGDAQIFCNTALLNLRAGNFYRQWLAALRDSFVDTPEGGYSDVAPDIGFRHGSAGWGDAGVIVPYTVWLQTGDTAVLEENFPTLQRWIDLQASQAPDGIRHSQESYGDWLAPGFPPGKAPPAYELIATAYFARTTELAAQIADILGKSEIAAKNRALLQKIKAAYRRAYIADDGKIAGDVQTSYVLSLGFDLVPAELRDAVIQQLRRTITEKNDHLATGFLGTPMLAPVLTQCGLTDLAYKIVEQETYPGWLFSVKNGATTIWERWDSWTPERGFNPDGMNSFNHYAFGSIASWFYETIAGLRADARAPGWKHFFVAPHPGGGLTYAKAEIVTPHGAARSHWTIDKKGQFQLHVSIPPNTTATVSLPGEKVKTLREGGKASKRKTVVNAGRIEVELGSGEYAFSVAL